MKLLKATIFLFLVFLFAFDASSQNKKEVLALYNIMEVHKGKPDLTFAKDNHNELQFVFSGLFVFYKTFVSSQDMQTCTFTPSCSEYAMQSVKQQGIFTGLLNAFDRLSRCNGLSPEEYEQDEHTHLFKDPL